MTAIRIIDDHIELANIGSRTHAQIDEALDPLTDNSIADVLHRHSELVASDGSPDPAVSVDATGQVGIGTQTPSQECDLIGNLELEYTIDNNTGVIYKNTDSFIHNFQHPTGGGAVPTGHNLFIGINAGNFLMGSTATQTQHASHNIGIGRLSLFCNTIGYNNVAMGSNALYLNTTGYRNFAMGASALYSNTIGHGNFAIGTGTLYNNISGNDNVAIGTSALYYNTSADKNTAIGTGALFANTIGYQNIAMGSYAGRYITGNNPNQTSNTSVYLGASTKALADGGINEIVIGYNATGVGSNSVVLGNDSITKTILKGQVVIKTTIPDAALQVIGDTKFGDDNTNYATFAADGELTLVGTARVEKSSWLPFNALKAPGTKPATFVDHGISGAWQFADGTDDTLVFNAQTPVDMDITVAPNVKVGWSTNTTVTTETAVWQLEYLWSSAGEDTTAAAQETLTASGNAVAQSNGLVVTEITGIDVPSATDMCLHCRLKRLGADGNDDLTDTAELHGVCLGYTANKFGTAT